MRWSVVLLVASLTACEAPTDVQPFDVRPAAHDQGGYHLRTWNGRAVPTRYSSGLICPAGNVEPCHSPYTNDLLSADLSILGENWQILWHHRVTWGGSDSVTTYTATARGRVVGGTFLLAASEVGGMQASFVGNDATLRCCATGPGAPLGGEVWVFGR